MQPQSKKLTEEEKITLTSLFIVKIRDLKKNDKIGPPIMLNNLEALNNNEIVSADFTNLKDFYLNPTLFPEEDIAETLLERRTILQQLLKNEIESLNKHKKVTTDLSKRRSLSLSSSISALLSNHQTIISWAYIEFDAITFISALLTKNEQQAHDCLFKQTISLDTRCFPTSDGAASIMSSNAPYQFQLYKSCLIPLLIGFEITTHLPYPQNTHLVTLKNYSPINISILSCILGNNKFSKKFDMKTETDDAIKNKSDEFVEKYMSFFCIEQTIKNGDKIIPEENVRNKPKSGCILS